jgi:hypothetical protein
MSHGNKTTRKAGDEEDRKERIEKEETRKMIKTTKVLKTDS